MNAVSDLAQFVDTNNKQEELLQNEIRNQRKSIFNEKGGSIHFRKKKLVVIYLFVMFYIFAKIYYQAI